MAYKTTIIKEKSKDVEECQILGGIDTLYCFLDCIGLASKELYQTLWASVNDGSFVRENYHFNGFSGKKNGFIGGWYTYIGRDCIPLFRVGFKNPTKQKQIKNIFIQFEGSGIYSLGFYDLLNFVRAEFSDLLGFDVSNDNLILSRVDLNAFVDGFDFSFIDDGMFRTRAYKVGSYKNECLDYEELETYEYRSRRGVETLYLGDYRSSPLYMKIYDKLKELTSKNSDISSMVKRYFLLSNGMKSDHIWNVEFTIKKEVLTQYSAFTVSDLLYLADSIFKDLMRRNSFLGFDTEKISSSRISKNISKLPLHPIWEKIIEDYKFCNYDVEVQRTYKEYKKGSRSWSTDTIMRECKKQKDLGQSYTLQEWTAMFYQSQKEL